MTAWGTQFLSKDLSETHLRHRPSRLADPTALYGMLLHYVGPEPEDDSTRPLRWSGSVLVRVWHWRGTRVGIFGGAQAPPSGR